MAAITKAEVKNFILIQDTFAEDEAATLSTEIWKRLSKKYVSTIARVTTSTGTYGSTSPWTTTNLYKTTKDAAGYTLVMISTGSTSTGGTFYFTYGYNDYEDNIARLIPQVEYDLCSYLNNYFDDPAIFVHHGSGLAFVGQTTAADYITDDNDDFSTAGFAAAMDVIIRGGSNAGIHTIASVSSGTLTLNSTGVLISQDQDVAYNAMGGIKIARIKWPQEIKPYLAQMVWYRLKHSRPDNIASERLDDYSVTYINGNAYPTEVLKGVGRWKRAVVK